MIKRSCAWQHIDRIGSNEYTAYACRCVYFVGVGPDGKLSLNERFLARAMGMWANQQRILLSTEFQLWRFENVLAPGQKQDNGCDKFYVPRVAHTTGDIDVHEIEVLADGRILFVNTMFSCLALLSPTHSFTPFWKPPINGLALQDGEPAYVTAVSRSDVVNGWHERRAEGGCIIDVRSNEIITDNLSMPHSPRWHNGELWVINSGTGFLGTVDIETGKFDPRIFCPGFLRGLAFHDGHAIVGLSLPRNGAFSELQLDKELKKRDAEPWCGIQIINLKSGDIVQWIKLGGTVSELFSLSVIAGVCQPMSLGFLTNEIKNTINIQMPEDAQS